MKRIPTHTKSRFSSFFFLFIVMCVTVGGYTMFGQPSEYVIPSISLSPQTILPGDPVLITIHGTSTPVKVLFDTKELPIFLYEDIPRALAAIDFNEKVLKHTVKVTLENGEVLTREIVLTPRKKIERPVGIPEKLGGNTPMASSNLVSNLSKENAVLASIKSTTTQLWSGAFRAPLKHVVVTDDYGYDRKTVEQTIVHKGTDFRAATGTPVYAMNEGTVTLARTFTVYGNTIIIDHGLGVHTLYMHLSKIDVKVGDTVKLGDVIGESGMTGYAAAPHLHVSIKVGGVSIDPMVFVGLWE